MASTNNAASSRVVSYSVDSEDKILGVGDAWGEFAASNGEGDRLKPDSVVGKTLWDFVRGQTLVELYRDIFGRVRDTGRPVRFDCRCDSPNFQRRMEMTVAHLGRGRLQLTSRTLSVIKQEKPLVAHAYDVGLSVLKRCSLCNLYELQCGDWTDASTAVECDAVMDQQGRVQIAWTVCPPCRKDLVAMGTPTD
ncbi:hypothetical protein Pla123a_11130 [Posidoniimonas polymericola]|uniref:PAS fold protein n=1 Tax=Posidoniimonas polymericola TaxID=2528002 RepID=A0A5C5YTJ1_9BACT|nr:hypothetical protein [Posidoniimonas polymericola]TWT78322.1 hypothetical protein Pla123a_11130 [Posidoniimonas polymericola]